MKSVIRVINSDNLILKSDSYFECGNSSDSVVSFRATDFHCMKTEIIFAEDINVCGTFKLFLLNFIKQLYANT
jgi:hypothetical protein